MGYYVNIDDNLSFANADEKSNFFNAMSSDDYYSRYESVDRFLCEEIACEIEKISEFEYTFRDSDVHYNEQDYTLVDILKENNIDATLIIELVGEDGENWRTTYDKTSGKQTEKKVYLSDAVVRCKNCKYATEHMSHSNDIPRYKCGYWTTIAGNDVRILMDKNDYCSKGECK